MLNIHTTYEPYGDHTDRMQIAWFVFNKPKFLHHVFFQHENILFNIIIIIFVKFKICKLKTFCVVFIFICENNKILNLNLKIFYMVIYIFVKIFGT